MTEQHSARTHFTWAASQSSGNFTCAGRIALGAIFPEQPETLYGATGTAVHEISDKALKSGGMPADSLGDIIKTDAHEIVITEKEVDAATAYVNFVRSLPGEALIETKFTLDSLDTPFPAGGTADARVLDLPNRHMHIVDLKNGTWFVDVNENKQLRTYALCCLLALDHSIANRVERVTSTIVQPNAGGAEVIRSETYHKIDLLDWAADLLVAMNRSKQAETEFAAVNGNSVLLDEWVDKWLVTGNCKFCRAEGGCPKRRKEALAAMPEFARQWHEDVTLVTPPALSNLAKLGSVEELEHDLAGLDELEAWASARRAYAKQLAEAGTKFKDWMLVDSVGHRKFVEKDEKALAASLMKTFALTDDKVYAKKVKSPAQLEKALTAAQKKEFTKLEKTLWVKPITGRNLVRRDKSIREEAVSLTERFNETVD